MAEYRFEMLNEVEIELIKTVNTHRKPRRSKFHLFLSFAWLDLNLKGKLLYVVNFAVCYRTQQSKVWLS